MANDAVVAPTRRRLVVDSSSRSSRGFVFHSDTGFIAFPVLARQAVFCIWIEVPERCTLTDDGSGRARGGNGCRAACRPPAVHVGRSPGDARRARPARGAKPTLAVGDLTRARRREEHAAPDLRRSRRSRLGGQGRRRRFSLGIRALRLARSSSELPIVTAFKTVAAEFLTRHDESIALAILDGFESLFVALEETSQPVRLVTTWARRPRRSRRRAGVSSSRRIPPLRWRRCSGAGSS